MKSLLSIIIPVFNAELHIERCVESILLQDYKDIELILIDDCSTDGTSNIIKKFLKRNDFKIKYFKNEKNMGCSYSRNLGIKISSGSYIAFVDSDDYVHPQMYSNMMKMLLNKNLDIVVCGIEIRDRINNTRLEKKLNIKKRIDYFTTNGLIENPVNKIFKKKNIIEYDIKFPLNTHYAEDWAFCFKAMLVARYVGYVRECYYKYIIHGNNSVCNLQNKVGVFNSYTDVLAFYKKLKCTYQDEIINQILEDKLLFFIKYICFILSDNKIIKDQNKYYRSYFVKNFQRISKNSLKIMTKLYIYNFVSYLVYKFKLFFILDFIKKIRKHKVR